MKLRRQVWSQTKQYKKIAGSGVNRVSVGQITHSAPIIDFKLNF